MTDWRLLRRQRPLFGESLLGVPTRSPYSESLLGVPTRSLYSESQLRVPTRSPYSESLLRVPTQSPDSESRTCRRSHFRPFSLPASRFPLPRLLAAQRLRRMHPRRPPRRD